MYYSGKSPPPPSSYIERITVDRQTKDFFFLFGILSLMTVYEELFKIAGRKCVALFHFVEPKHLKI